MIAFTGSARTRIDQSPMEGEDFAVRLTTKISPLASHHQPLALSLHRGERQAGNFQHHRPQIGDIERVIVRQRRQ